NARVDPLELILAFEEISRNLAIRGLGESPRRPEQEHERRRKTPHHTSPPARSASGVFFGRAPALRPSAPLYHVNSQAAAIMTRMPNALAVICIQKAPEISVIAKW